MPAAIRTVYRRAQLGSETVEPGGRYRGRPKRLTSDAFRAHVHVIEPLNRGNQAEITMPLHVDQVLAVTGSTSPVAVEWVPVDAPGSAAACWPGFCRAGSRRSILPSWEPAVDIADGASSRYLSGRWYWRPCQGDAERVRAGLLQLARRIGRPAVLIPTDDAGAIFLAEQGDGLRPWFLFPEPPRDLPRRLAGKHSLYHLCRELGVACLHATMHSATGPAVTTGCGMPRPAVVGLRQGRPCGRKPRRPSRGPGQ